MPEESTVEQRNTDLFFEIADVIDFTPQFYDQTTWGEWFITDEKADALYKKLGARLYEELQNSRGWGDSVEWAAIECDTAMCVAGHAANLSGYHPVYMSYQNKQRFEWNRVNKEPLRHDGESVEGVARTLLGLTEDESNILFASEHPWSADDLRAFGKGKSILQFDPDLYDPDDFEEDEE